MYFQFSTLKMGVEGYERNEIQWNFLMAEQLTELAQEVASWERTLDDCLKKLGREGEHRYFLLEEDDFSDLLKTHQMPIQAETWALVTAHDVGFLQVHY